MAMCSLGFLQFLSLFWFKRNNSQCFGASTFGTGCIRYGISKLIHEIDALKCKGSSQSLSLPQPACLVCMAGIRCNKQQKMSMATCGTVATKIPKPAPLRCESAARMDSACPGAVTWMPGQACG